MKKTALIYIGVALLLSLAATGWRMRPAEPEGSELYERYKDTPGIRAGFAKGFMVNDSLRVDVTTLEYLDSTLWDKARTNLGPNFDNPEIAEFRGLVNETTLEMYYSERYHPEVWGEELMARGLDTMDVVVVSPYFHWMASYHCTSKDDARGVAHTYLKRRFQDLPLTLPAADKDTISGQ